MLHANNCLMQPQSLIATSGIGEDGYKIGAARLRKDNNISDPQTPTLMQQYKSMLCCSDLMNNRGLAAPGTSHLFSGCSNPQASKR
jgi:hypothetical protein